MPLLTFIVNCPDAASADKIASDLVSRGLVACANFHPPVRSLYHWKGQLQSVEEIPLVLKTRPDLRNEVESEIARLHPYEVPPILRLTLDANTSYLGWVNAETGSPSI
ncbi:divalent-cation tolerance protein CutA [Tropicimonas sp.]|uniref:divalent-cation tolerance protein CutA n=1 Tax=Tropicimonas sp. TaxID=2067044 RepID=UPI003A8A9CAC